MKKEDITIGKVYTDGKGNVREVVAMGPQFVLYTSQTEKDNLQYRIIAKKSGPFHVGQLRNSTRASFAGWAKSEG